MCGCCLYNSRFLYDIRFYEQTPPQAGRIPTLPRHSPHLRKYHLDFSSGGSRQGSLWVTARDTTDTTVQSIKIRKLNFNKLFVAPSPAPSPTPTPAPSPTPTACSCYSGFTHFFLRNAILPIVLSLSFIQWFIPFFFLSFCPLHPRFQLSPVCIFSSRCSSIHSFLLPFFFTNRLVWWMPGDTQRPIKETDLQV